MALRDEPVSLEFVDPASDEPAGVERDTPQTAPRAAPVLAALAIAVAALLVVLAIANRPDPPEVVEERPAPSLPSSTIAPTTAPPQSLVEESSDSVEFVPFPDLPEDHDPILTSAPGSGEPILGGPTNATLVYVNVLGRPTVIDLDTAEITQVIVSAVRSRDTFAVTNGAVVSSDGSSEVVAAAMRRATEFHTFRDADATATDSQFASTVPGPLLCLSEFPCEVTGWQSNTVTRGSIEYRYVTEAVDPDIYDALFGGDWTVDELYRYAPDGSLGDLRLPRPLHQDAWLLIEPPENPTE